MSGLLGGFLTRDQIAAELRVTPRKISRWQAHDGLPHTALGGRVLFRREAVAAWIAGCERRTAA